MCLGVDRYGKVGGGEYRYRYNGKELNEGFGLYDYGARWYDPTIARLTTVDPLATEMPGWSPYNYTFGNPVNFTDPTGMIPAGLNKMDYEFGFAKLVQGNLDDIIFRTEQEDGSYKEVSRIKTDDFDVTFDIDRETAESLNLEDVSLPVADLDDIQDLEDKRRLQAISVDLSAEGSFKVGAQGELSLIGMVAGPAKGRWGLAFQVNGLIGFEGSATLGMSFYFAPKGQDLSLNDLSGFESGVQGSIYGIGGAYFEGLKFTTSQPFIQSVYKGFSYGGSVGLPQLSGSGSVYAGYSTFLYKNRK